ncbi:MAG: hypothetical protein OEQ47_07130 [Acidimicrobiia bacterium]|nr:hypothetical protein [Acidimicrobiia bacterium]
MKHMNNTLQEALVANAVFSGTTGIGAIALADVLAGSLGPPAWSLRALGVGLVVFAAVVAGESRAPRARGTSRIIAADVAWVATAVIIIMVSPGWLTGVGRAVLAAVTIAVAALAAGQWRGFQMRGPIDDGVDQVLDG